MFVRSRQLHKLLGKFPAPPRILIGRSSNVSAYKGKFSTASITPRVPSQKALLSSTPVARWLFGTAGAVAIMTTVGGVTRLTRSGLSMTDWKLQGSLPPISQQEWQEEFDRYKQFPEYQQRKSMTLDEFKYIYFWEYLHRMMGRTIGLIYGVPLVYFAARGVIPRHLYGKLAALLGLGGAQGLIGWWMVKSGLEDPLMDPAKSRQIRVSPYRLSVHLGMAFTTFSLLVYTGLQALHGPLPPKNELLESAGQKLVKEAQRLRGGSIATKALVFVTVLGGALVAGNDAGHAYNMWPKMTEDSWHPPGMFDMKPLWRNFFENTATVQAQHRNIAYTTVSVAAATVLFARFGAGGKLWAVLPSTSRKAVTAVALVAAGQGALGITTLLLYDPLPLAAAHQATALLLLGTAVWSTHSLRFVKAAAKAVR